MEKSASTKRHRDERSGGGEANKRVSKKPNVSTSEGPTDDIDERWDETSNVDKLMHDEVEHTTNVDERDTDDEKTEHGATGTQPQTHNHSWPNLGAPCHNESNWQDLQPPETHDRSNSESPTEQRKIIEDQKDGICEAENITKSLENDVESQVLCKTNPEGLKANALQKQDETSNVDEQRQDDVEQKRNEGDKRKLGHNEDDEVQMRRDEASSHQTRGEKGDTESVKNGTSNSETNSNINLKTSNNCATLGEVKCSGDEKKRENLPRTEDNTQSTITLENTKNKSEELKKTKVDDGEQLKHFNDQHLDDKTKREEQIQRGDLTDKVRERQGDDSGTEELKGDEVERKRNVSNQARRGEEIEGQRGDQIRGEEDDAEVIQVSHDTEVSVELENMIGKTQCHDKSSHGIKMTTGANRATQNEVKTSGDKKQDNLSLSEDGTRPSTVQTNTNEVKEDHALLNLGETTDDCRKQKLDEEKKTDKQGQKVTLPHRRHYGLRNQGATCYLNSVLQVLFMSTEIHGGLTKLQTDLQLRKLFEELKKKTCGTETITETFGIVNVFEQRDAAECLEMILRTINPEASEVFQGQLTHTTKCSKGHIIIEETKPFWNLPLSLKDSHDKTISVESSFKMIFHPKSFTGDNQVFCNECDNKTKATSTCEMVKSPQILTLLLKRFDFDYSTMSYVKSNCCVDVPRALQIENKTYKLYGMVDHMGSVRGGHYTATVLSSEDNTWYECNDAYVSKAKHQLFAETGTYNSRTVYLLMYRGENSLRARGSASRIRSTICRVFRPGCCLLFIMACCYYHCCRSAGLLHCLKPKLAHICRFLNLCG